MTIEAAVPRADGWMVFGASASARKAAMPGMRRRSLRRDSFCIDWPKRGAVRCSDTRHR